VGRPSGYTQEIGDSICDRLAEGESLRSICRDDAMPAMSTVFRWLATDESFAEQYARAREEQADALADEIVAIADESDVATKVDGEQVTLALDATAIARNRLRVDARKWVAAKLKPRKYGDKIQHADADGEKLPPATIVINPVAPRVE
jgi:frataxin-like iron-binding protein CyaY